MRHDWPVRRRRRREAEEGFERAARWAADEQNAAWLDELDEAIGAGDLPRVEAAQAALRRPHGRERGWPAPAEVPLEERDYCLPPPMDAAGPETRPLVTAPPRGREPTRSTAGRPTGAYARRRRP